MIAYQVDPTWGTHSNSWLLTEPLLKQGGCFLQQNLNAIVSVGHVATLAGDDFHDKAIIRRTER